MPWINGQSSGTRIGAGGGLVVVNADGSVSITPATGTGVLLGVAPPATATRALFQIGNGPTDGVTAGHYTGSASGGGYGANFASGYAGDLLRLQIAGADKLFVDKLGNVAFASGSSLTSGGAALSGISNGWQASSGSDISVLLVRTAGTANTTPVLVARGGPSQVGDVFQMQDNGLHPQWGIANVGSGAAPIWAMRVRAVANAESMAQLHTLGSYSGRAVQIVDDAGASLGYLPLYA